MMLAGGRSWRNWGQKKETYTLDETLKEQKKKNMGFLKPTKQKMINKSTKAFLGKRLCRASLCTLSPQNAAFLTLDRIQIL